MIAPTMSTSKKDFTQTVTPPQSEEYIQMTTTFSAQVISDQDQSITEHSMSTATAIITTTMVKIGI